MVLSVNKAQKEISAKWSFFFLLRNVLIRVGVTLLMPATCWTVCSEEVLSCEPVSFPLLSELSKLWRTLQGPGLQAVFCGCKGCWYFSTFVPDFKFPKATFTVLKCAFYSEHANYHMLWLRLPWRASVQALLGLPPCLLAVSVLLGCLVPVKMVSKIWYTIFSAEE